MGAFIKKTLPKLLMNNMKKNQTKAKNKQNLDLNYLPESEIN